LVNNDNSLSFADISNLAENPLFDTSSEAIVDLTNEVSELQGRILPAKMSKTSFPAAKKRGAKRSNRRAGIDISEDNAPGQFSTTTPFIPTIVTPTITSTPSVTVDLTTGLVETAEPRQLPQWATIVVSKTEERPTMVEMQLLASEVSEPIAAEERSDCFLFTYRSAHDAGAVAKYIDVTHPNIKIKLTDLETFDQRSADASTSVPFVGRQTSRSRAHGCSCKLLSTSKGDHYSCSKNQSPAKAKKCPCAEDGKKCTDACLCFCNVTTGLFLNF
jgi:hypothetical protein